MATAVFPGRAAGGLCALMLALAVLAAGALAQTLAFPALTGRVVDEAGILDAATRNTLTQKSAALEAKTGKQLVMVTLRSLQGTSIEDFGVQLGRHWGIGQRGKDSGVLLIVAPSERKVRIEVGYGLEDTLTDAVSKLIIENAIVPRFRANDFAGGIARGADDIIQVLSGDADEFQQRAAGQPAPHSSPPVRLPFPGALIPLVMVLWLWPGILFFIILVVIKRRLGSGRSSSRGSSWSSDSSGGGGSFGGGSSSSGGDFSGGGGSFGGGGASGSW
jgi:uncharacterized protein